MPSHPFGKPYLITTKELVVKKIGVMSREYQLRTHRIGFFAIEKGYEHSGNHGVHTAAELIDYKHAAAGQGLHENRCHVKKFVRPVGLGVGKGH